MFPEHGQAGHRVERSRCAEQGNVIPAVVDMGSSGGIKGGLENPRAAHVGGGMLNFTANEEGHAGAAIFNKGVKLVAGAPPCYEVVGE